MPPAGETSMRRPGRGYESMYTSGRPASSDWYAIQRPSGETRAPSSSARVAAYGRAAEPSAGCTRTSCRLGPASSVTSSALPSRSQSFGNCAPSRGAKTLAAPSERYRIQRSLPPEAFTE